VHEPKPYLSVPSPCASARSTIDTMVEQVPAPTRATEVLGRSAR
jgi:hypothetical protein